MMRSRQSVRGPYTLQGIHIDYQAICESERERKRGRERRKIESERERRKIESERERE
jgi:hypothetical protein